ncbi:MAG: methyltransferase [Salibacteraceae bacterium]
MSTWKIAFSFLVPIFVLVVIPGIIHYGLEPLAFQNVFSTFTGILFLLTGISFLAWSSALFVAFGNGTPGPWFATEKLVILGPYRFVRNPMNIAVITTLWGETLLFGSFYILAWSILYWLISVVWLKWWEEPRLEQKFGEIYLRYKKEVPNWIPLSKPIEFDP